jgi:hypothetical protein
MIKNYLETGTPFDYKDFRRDNQLANDEGLIPQVGEQDIPDRDVRYVDKDFEDED